MKNILRIFILVGLTLLLVGCKKVKRTPAYPGAKVPYLDGEWVAIWADEFDDDKLDTTKWSNETGGDGWGNNELQYYTYANTNVGDGTLKINAKKEQRDKNNYTSARIVTRDKFSFKYGRVITRAKLPVGRGTWPAIWMMPQNSVYGGWPNSGEIDIMEYVGYEPNRVHGSIHTEVYNHKIGTQKSNSLKYDNLTDDFHEFELVWLPGFIEMSIDGLVISTFRYNAIFEQEYEAKQAFPFDQEFYLILNLAIGGSWGGQQGVDDSIFPAVFEIDYIRVYQKDYKYLDKEKPEAPKNIQASRYINNSIVWNEAKDDYGIHHYNVFVDGEFYGEANLPQITLKGLTVGKKYNIEIEAIDFTGKVSPKSSFEHVFK